MLALCLQLRSEVWGSQCCVLTSLTASGRAPDQPRFWLGWVGARSQVSARWSEPVALLQGGAILCRSSYLRNPVIRASPSPLPYPLSCPFLRQALPCLLQPAQFAHPYPTGAAG